jgi:hypothetical protein
MEGEYKCEVTIKTLAELTQVNNSDLVGTMMDYKNSVKSEAIY